MNRPYLLALLVPVFLASSAFAQPDDKTKSADKSTTPANSTTKDAEAERILKERRDNAQSLLISLAADAGQFTDQTLRARTQARIADVLWASDPDRARTLFRKAWESAESVDQENQRKFQEEVNQQKAKGGGVSVTRPRNIRAEVLRLAARRDRALGEEFLSKLRTETAQEAEDKVRSNRFQSPEAQAQRLNLARQLLDSDDVERAIQFADPALTAITRDTIDFLSYLREKDSGAADPRYAAFLTRAAGDLQADANTVSMLSSYLFTPHTFVEFTGSGASTTSTGRNVPPPNVTPELRAAFFRIAGEILMRPLAPAGQDQSSTGVQGKYLMLKRLMPLFERYASREMVDALNGQMQALAQAVPEDARARDDDTVREGIRPPESSDDRERYLRDRVDRAKTAEERDGIYMELARLYASNGDIRARDFVEKIEDSDVRKQARSFYDTSLVNRAIDKKEPDRVLELLRTAEVTHLQKAWALTQAAKLLVKTDKDKAIAAIEEATLEAKRIDTSDADRPRALMAVANAWLLTDRAKAWDALYDAIKAANSSEGFTGEDGLIRTTLITKNGSSIRSNGVSEFNVAGILTELAREDYDRAIELARGFQKEAPRASSTISIARAILEEKKK
jgi:hypothetical protein